MRNDDGATRRGYLLKILGRLPGPGTAGLIVTLTASAAVAACGTTPSPHQPGRPASSVRPSAPSSASSPSVSPSAPARGFRVLSMTFVSDQRGFALGSVGCATGRCGALLGTADGGQTWHRLTPPTRALGGVYSTCQHGRPCVQEVRFATPLIGYAFSPALLMTTDGGLHWRLLKMTGVTSLEAAGGTVVRIASGYEGCAGGPYEVESAADGTNSWQALATPPIEMICPPVLYRQGSRVVLAGYGNAAGGVRATAQIDRSADGGRTWTKAPDSCGGKDGYASTLALAPPSTLVLLCKHQMPRPDGSYSPAWIRVSTDGGGTFGPDRRIPSAFEIRKGMIISYQLAAASASRLLVAETGSHGSVTLMTRNSGRTWVMSLDSGREAPVLLVGFQNPRTARAAAGNLVWTTANGGRTWRQDHFTG